MNTKNIFRMLLVAAALLMGANNVKATETIIWQGVFSPDEAMAASYDVDWYSNLKEGDKIRVYLSNRQISIKGSWNTSLDFKNASDSYISDFTATSETGGYFDAVFSASAASAIKGWNYQNLDISIGPDITVTQIDGIKPDGTLELTLHYPTSESISNSTFSFDPNNGWTRLASLAEDYTLRIYVTIGNTMGKIHPFCNDSNINLLSSSDGYSDCTRAEFIAGYKDITLTANNAELLKNNHSLRIKADNIGMKKYSIISESQPGGGKADVTLAFNNPTTTTTVGTNVTNVATATSNGNTVNVDIRYSSSNTGVATVNETTGEVTPLSAGQTTITATFAGNNEYNGPTSVSYTLTVNAASQPTYSVTVSAGSNGTASAVNSATAGQDVTVTVTPSNGYAIENIRVVDASNNPVAIKTSGKSGDSAFTFTFEMPSSNVTVSATFTEGNYLKFKTEDYCAATWDASTNTFTWGNRNGWNTAWTFMAAKYTDDSDVKDNLSSWTHLRLHVSDWNNVSDENKKLNVLFKSVNTNGDDPNAGPTKLIEGTPDAWGNIDINLANVTDWSPCDITNIHDLTIYGRTRIVDSQAASVKVTYAYYLTAPASTKQNVTLAFSATTATAIYGEDYYAPTLTATLNGEGVTVSGITYSSSNPNVATVNASTGEVTIVGIGTTTITASLTNNETFNDASASYTLTVNEAAPSESDYITVTGIDYGYRTYVTPQNQAIDFSRSVGVEGYYAESVDEAHTVVTLKQVTGVCAGNVPLVLVKQANATEFKLLKSSAAGTTPSPNLLVAGPATASGSNIYVLTYHSGQVVFAETNINSASVDGEHAYLNLNTGSNARGQISIHFVKANETVGISDVETEAAGQKVIYNLRGQRVDHPTKGLYIINGRKVVIK